MEEVEIWEGIHQLRGHRIKIVDGIWIYCDTKEPTAGNRKNCGFCSKEDTSEGHDGCIGTLPQVMNACCGHGIPNDAYVQFDNGKIIRGKTAIAFLIQKRDER